MKRLDLIRHLERHGCELLREGGNHTIYVNRPARKGMSRVRAANEVSLPRRNVLLAQLEQVVRSPAASGAEGISDFQIILWLREGRLYGWLMACS